MFGKLLQFLTGARRNEGARMVRQERVGDDWIIPGARVKAKREFLLHPPGPLWGSWTAFR
jgi:hypothetical protein